MIAQVAMGKINWKVGRVEGYQLEASLSNTSETSAWEIEMEAVRGVEILDLFCQQN